MRLPGSSLAVLLGTLSMGLPACSGGDRDDASRRPDGTGRRSSTPTTAAPARAEETTPSAAAPETTGGSGPGSSTSTTATSARQGGSGGARSFDPRGLVRVGPAGTELADRAGGELLGRLRGGVLVPFDLRRDAWLRILTPCERQHWIREADAEPIGPFEVVLDPGHGGADEPGAVGPTGLTEAELNLDVAARAVKALEGEGVRAVLTRELDYRATLAFRAALAAAAGAPLLISIHHNADPDGPRPGPGTETYYQIRSAASKRMAGLVYEEVVARLSEFPADWVADRDAGAKIRASSSGEDFYGILRHSANRNIPAVLAELAFISNPTEEALLRRPDVRQAEAAAVARSIRRFIRGPDPGSGFVEAYERGGPAGPGGGRRGCADPS